MELSKETLEFFKQQGKKGGKKTKQLHPEHFSRAGKLGNQIRWKNHKKIK